ncbi:MAG: recombinase family protein [Acetobacter sp.]|nr:recombinase family protein [Bacteroides sp.]MCM1340116.1 recombinase family protein [Acetobacter sp.]MCM1432698.1 recombinase family protein [Clostridiales bacterium]
MTLSKLESKEFGKVCYGFKRNKQGLIEIDSEKANVVKRIFDLYKGGNSLEEIQVYLLQNDISSPTGKTKWSRDVLNKVLNNYKYTKGIISFTDFCDVYVMKTSNSRNTNRNDERYLLCQELLKKNCIGHIS